MCGVSTAIFRGYFLALPTKAHTGGRRSRFCGGTISGTSYFIRSKDGPSRIRRGTGGGTGGIKTIKRACPFIRNIHACILIQAPYFLISAKNKIFSVYGVFFPCTSSSRTAQKLL